MTKIKTGLGRGLDALINPKVKKEVDEPITVSANNLGKDDGKSIDILAKIPVKSIFPNPYQPRMEFDKETMDDLKKSILENGLIQPITVRRNGDGGYELISGERRLRACKDIGYKEIPAYIIQVDTKEAMLALSLIENLQRDELNPIEVAMAYKRLMDECNLTQEDIANKVGKDRSTITNSVRLLKLPDEIKKSIILGEISAGHARPLINLPSEIIQLELWEKIKKNQLSVRKVEGIVKKIVDNKYRPIHAKKEAEMSVRDEISLKDIEEKLRNLFGTKVICKQKKSGQGTILIEFYSNEELERLFELFEIIEKPYS